MPVIWLDSSRPQLHYCSVPWRRACRTVCAVRTLAKAAAGASSELLGLDATDSPIREASAETRVAQQVPTLFSADPGQCWASRRREDSAGWEDGAGQAGGRRMVVGMQEREDSAGQAGGGSSILGKQEAGGAPLHLYVHLLCVA